MLMLQSSHKNRGKKSAPWPVAPVWSGFPPAAALAPAAAQPRLAASMAPWRDKGPPLGDNHDQQLLSQNAGEIN